MRILLIVHDVYQDDNAFPLAEGYIASSLRKQGNEVQILCMDVFHQSNEWLARFLKHNKFDIIGIGFMAARFRETILPLCKTINKHKGNAKLVLGGHCPSAIPKYVLGTTNADAVVVGEGEFAITQDMKGIKLGKLNGNINNLPFPAWNLTPMKHYITCKQYPGQKQNENSISIVTSRGCVNKCSFCYRMTKGLKMRGIKNVVDEIEKLYYGYNVHYFEFTDECFVPHKKRLERLREELDERNLSIHYWCAVRTNLVDEDTLNLLKETGCKFINYGFESMDWNVLDMMHKNTTPEDNIQAARLTKEKGILFGMNFIWGMPGDTVETLNQNKEFIMKYNTYGQIRTIRPVTPFPGCELYYKAINEGLLEGEEDFFNRFKNSDKITVNYTNLTDNEMYDALYKTNSELIDDQLQGKQAEQMKNNFYRLYYEPNYVFRGARHYEKM